MADYIYLLETRLSKAQQAALATVRDIARENDTTVFLVGGAIRDLTSGAPVRDLDVAVQSNALKLKTALAKAGAEISGEVVALQQLHVRFPGGVRIEVGSTLSTSYPKPGRVIAKPANILDDLRRRDFTANAMALSLNEGSYGLLMDPLNGVADIENRELRLVSNYGFIEDPVRLIRAARLMARSSWQLEEKTLVRYETAKEERYIGALQNADRAYELEELFHEEDPLRVMRRLEEEGWLKELSPLLSVTKANIPELTRLRDTQMQLQERGVVADAAAAAYPLLTAKLSAKDAQSIKDSFPRRAFVREIESLEQHGKELATHLVGKQAALPSQAYQMIVNTPPATVLWTAFTSKNAALQAKFKSFYADWPQNRQRIPYLLMQEMRITPEIPNYDELLDKVFFALMDGKLETPEAMRAFLEPYSPPAPPPPISLRRPRAAKTAKKEARPAKAKKQSAEPSSPEPTGDAASKTIEDAPPAISEAPAQIVSPGKKTAAKAAQPNLAAAPSLREPKDARPAKAAEADRSGSPRKLPVQATPSRGHDAKHPAKGESGRSASKAKQSTPAAAAAKGAAKRSPATTSGSPKSAKKATVKPKSAPAKRRATPVVRRAESKTKRAPVRPASRPAVKAKPRTPAKSTRPTAKRPKPSLKPKKLSTKTAVKKTSRRR